LDNLDEEAFLGFAGDDGGDAAAAALAGGFAGVEIEAAFGLLEFGAVAAVAAGGEDGADLRFEELDVFGSWQEGRGTQDQQKGTHHEL
jgi:hypothetical protein